MGVATLGGELGDPTASFGAVAMVENICMDTHGNKMTVKKEEGPTTNSENLNLDTERYHSNGAIYWVSGILAFDGICQHMWFSLAHC